VHGEFENVFAGKPRSYAVHGDFENVFAGKPRSYGRQALASSVFMFFISNLMNR
jgi:hypothetical protein